VHRTEHEGEMKIKIYLLTYLLMIQNTSLSLSLIGKKQTFTYALLTVDMLIHLSGCQRGVGSAILLLFDLH